MAPLRTFRVHPFAYVYVHTAKGVVSATGSHVDVASQKVSKCLRIKPGVRAI